MKFEFHLTIKPEYQKYINLNLRKHSIFNNIDKFGNTAAQEYLISWEAEHTNASEAVTSISYEMIQSHLAPSWISRIKIEQKPMIVSGLNFIYHEAHLKLKGTSFPSDLPEYAHRSINALSGSHWITLRKNDRNILIERYQELCNMVDVDEREIESIIVDTDRNKDNLWLSYEEASL